MENYLQPFDDVIRHKFIPAITDGHVVNEKEREMLSLTPRLGGLGRKNFVETALFEYDNTCNNTLHLKNLLLDKNEEGGKTKHQIQYERQQRQHARVRVEMTTSEKRLSKMWRIKLVDNPSSERMRHDLNKQQIRDAIRIRYN